MEGRWLLWQGALLLLVASACAQTPRQLQAGAQKAGDAPPIKRLPRVKVTKQPVAPSQQPTTPPPPPPSFFPAQPSHVPTPVEQQPEPQQFVAHHSSRPVKQGEDRDDAELLRQQAENAHYSFGTSVRDSIMDHEHIRQETRDGLKTVGMYSSSDGFYRHTVHYEADENGYRVTKEETEPIGEGPELNLDGHAEVETHIEGLQNKYSITADDIKDLKTLKQ